MQQQRRGVRGRGSVVSRLPKRGMFWHDTIVNLTLATNSAAQTDLDNLIPADERKGVTLTRTLIDLTVVTVAAGTGGVMSMGIYLVEDDAAAAGAFAEPEVQTDEVSWLWRLMRRPLFTSDPNDYSQAARLVYDIRGQRKYPGIDYTLWLVITTGTSTTSHNVDGGIRCLYKRA